MPIIIPKDLPAYSSLKLENIFVMNESRAFSQDIRPIEIAILNLMPTKVETETQLMRLLGNTPLQVNITLVGTATYRGTHTPEHHLAKFYKSYDEIKKMKFDGMIITGAPVETLPFNEVKYWNELQEIFDFIDDNVTSTIFICWGAQAALYYYYGIEKHNLPQKMFGVFGNRKTVEHELLLKGMDDIINIPVSRHTAIDEDKVRACPYLQVLAESDEAGISVIKSVDNKRIFLTGHSEYDRDTLKTEYLRDVAKGLDIAPPAHYFTDGPDSAVNMSWSGAANLLYYNWLNYYVYQITPFEIGDIKK
ncbi:MAG TPA: homoserine O-succinyltransferase [Candidatus Faecicola pullistercoris]|nr:homoserine O-succinyltransferase [Candidatus Faecicola pullistercoris]